MARSIQGGMNLNTTIITVGSVTYAIKAKRILEREGVNASLVKIDSSKNDNGCTHGIKIYESHLYDAVSILKRMGIEYQVRNSL